MLETKILFILLPLILVEAQNGRHGMIQRHPSQIPTIPSEGLYIQNDNSRIVSGPTSDIGLSSNSNTAVTSPHSRTISWHRITSTNSATSTSPPVQQHLIPNASPYKISPRIYVHPQTTTTSRPITRPTPTPEPGSEDLDEANRLYDYVCKEVNGYESVSNKCDDYDYIECEEDIAYLRTCPEGLHFNPAAPYPSYPCVYPTLEITTEPPHYTIPTTTTTTTTTTPKPITRPPTTHKPWTQPTQKPDINILYDYLCKEINGYEPLSNKCEDYVECKANKAYLRACPNGLRFNPAAQYPNYPCMYPSKELPVTEHHTLPQTTTTPKPVTRPTTTHKPWTQPTRNPVEINRLYDYVCREMDGFEAMPNKREDYVECKAYKAYLRTCPNGLRFNLAARYPNYPCIYPSKELPVTVHHTLPQTTTTPKPVTKPTTTHKPWTPPTQNPIEINRLYDYVCREIDGYEAVSNKCDDYVECTENIAYLKTCPHGLHFNRAARYPNYPCARPSIGLPIKEPPHYTIPTTTTTTTTTTTFKPITTTTTTPKPWTQPTEDPDEMYRVYDYVCKYIDGYERVPDRCGDYVECKRNKAYLRTCPHGFHFNPAARYPNYPCAFPSVEYPVTEEIHTHPQTTTTPRPTTTRTTSTPRPTTTRTTTTTKPVTRPTTTKPWTQPTQNIIESDILYDYVCKKLNGYEPISNKCEDYVECTDGLAHLRTCPVGLHFNIAARYPDNPCVKIPNHNNFNTKSTTTPKPVTRPTTTTTHKPRPQPTQSPYEPNRLYDYVCQKSDGYEVVLNKENQYIECKANKAYLRTCANGLKFNPAAQYPNYPCKKINNGRTDLQPDNDLCNHRSGIYPMPNGDCDHYLVCFRNVATIMDCPPGLAFNLTSSTCDWPGPVLNCNPDAFQGFSCPAPDTDEYGNELISKFRHNSSCKQYIACYDGLPRLLSCDGGKSFDQASETCIDSKQVQDCQD